MKNKFRAFLATLAAAMLCGCGHNAIQFSDGIGFDAGLDPEHWSCSFNLRYGKILSVAVRDCVELEMTGSGTGSGSGDSGQASGASATSGLKIRIGRQANGYTRDLIEAGATPDHIRALFSPTSASPSTNQDSSGSTM